MLFKQFPTNPALYSNDMQWMVEKTIERFGLDEWRAGVLTNELHGHLGIYAIMGIKMGIAALEYLKVEAGKVSIRSYAGQRPPISCMNDGLQVSTEATFGHGLITSPFTEQPKAMADFKAEDQTIRIKFKEDIELMIANEIDKAIKKYENTPPYWEYVRQLAIKYWAELDRKQIFDIVDI